MSLAKVLLALTILSFSVQVGFGQDGYISGTPRLAYWKAGSGSTIVIVLHGGPAITHTYLRPEWDSLSKVAQVIYYDQRGCGKSEKALCYSWREQVEDVKRVITQFGNGHKVILAGSSWGSQLALLYAYTYPDNVTGLILSGTYEWRAYGLPQQPCRAYLPNGEDTIDFYDTFPQKGTFEYTFPKEKRRVEEHYYVMNTIFSSLRGAPTLEQLKSIKVPVLLFEGGNCETSPIKDHAYLFRSVLPNMEIYTIAGACHDPWYTHTDNFFSKCIDFIGKLQVQTGYNSSFEKAGL